MNLNDNSANQALFHLWDGSAGYSLELYNTLFNFVVVAEDGGKVLATETQPNVSEWYFLVGTIDEANVNFYVNGSLVAQQSFVAPIANASPVDHIIVFGGRSDSQVGQLNGLMENVFKYDRALTESEISSLYNSGAGKSYVDLSTSEKTGLVSWWNFEETSGGRADSHGSNTVNQNSTIGWGAGNAKRAAGDHDRVSLWRDRSGVGNHLTQPTVSYRPRLNQDEDGKWQLRFDADDSTVLLGEAITDSEDYSLFARIREISPGNFGVAVSYGSGGAGTYWTGYWTGDSDEDGHLVLASDSTDDAWLPSAYQDTDWHVVGRVPNENGATGAYHGDVLIESKTFQPRSGNTVAVGAYTEGGNLSWTGDVSFLFITDGIVSQKAIKVIVRKANA